MNEGLKSSTVKTYISAIRAVLRELRIPISQDNYLISSLTKACHLKNDVVVQRFPIHKGVLKLLLTELSNLYAGTGDQQPYLESLYKAIYSTAYYGLLRIGEIAKSQHVILARNTHIGENKDKILFILITSKTHGKGDRPQKIKIARTPIRKHLVQSEPCPFGLLHKYISIRPPAINDQEQFFVFADNSPVYPNHIYSNLQSLLKNAGLQQNAYRFHGLRAGRTQDLMKLGLSVETIKCIGRWRSNAVYSYLVN